jgi:hypothetical protein
VKVLLITFFNLFKAELVSIYNLNNKRRAAKIIVIIFKEEDSDIKGKVKS